MENNLKRRKVKLRNRSSVMSIVIALNLKTPFSRRVLLKIDGCEFQDYDFGLRLIRL